MKNPKVLLVDDDEQTIKFMEQLQNEMEFDMVIAGNTKTAIEYSHNVDVVVVIMAPSSFFHPDSVRLEGVDIIRALRAEQPDVTVIAVGSGEEQKAKAAGADFFVNNIYDSWKLKAIIKGINS